MDSNSFKGDILIVDDTPDNLRLRSSWLSDREYYVRSVKNGLTARMSVWDLRQAPLQDKMLEKAIANLVGEFQRTSGILPLQINLSQPLFNQVSTAVYRLIQEGLTNIYKYAKATFPRLSA